MAFYYLKSFVLRNGIHLINMNFKSAAGVCRLSDGLGFGTEQIGISLGLSTLPLLFLQVYIFPAAESRFGSKKVCVLDVLLSSINVQYFQCNLCF